MEYKFMDLRKALAYDVLYCAKAMHGGHAQRLAPSCTIRCANEVLYNTSNSLARCP